MTELPEGDIRDNTKILPWKAPAAGQKVVIETQPGVVTANCPGGGHESHHYIVRIELVTDQWSVHTTSLSAYWTTFKGQRISVEEIQHKIQQDLVEATKPRTLSVVVTRDVYHGQQTSVGGVYAAGVSVGTTNG